MVWHLQPRSGINNLEKVVRIFAPIECYSAELFSIKKQKFFDDQCPNLIYFNIPSIIIYLSGIETLICHGEIELNRFFFLLFCRDDEIHVLYMIFKVSYWTQSDIVFDQCHKNRIIRSQEWYILFLYDIIRSFALDNVTFIKVNFPVSSIWHRSRAR